jgi:hypothetical protein
MNEYFYAREKLLNAIETLATGGGDVRERLLQAFTNFHTLTADDLPSDFKMDWAWIRKELTKYGPVMIGDTDEVLRGSVENTMRRIKRNTGRKIAQKLFRIGWELHTNEKYLR